MKKRTSILLLTGFCLIVVGSALAVGSFFAGGASTLYLTRNGILLPKEVSVAPYAKEVSEFKNINIEKSNIDIDIKEGSSYGVDFQPGPSKRFIKEGDDFDPSKMFSVEGDTLKITSTGYLSPVSEDGVQLGVGIGFYDKTDKLTITVPTTATIDAITSSSSMQNMSISSITAGKVDLGTSHGDISVRDSQFDSLNVKSSSGNLFISDVKVAGTAGLNLSYGDVTIESSEFKHLEGKSSSGTFEAARVTVTDGLTYKSSYGNFSFDGTSNGLDLSTQSGDTKLRGELTGDIKITSSYGSVWIESALPEDQYGFDAKTSYGEIKVGDRELGNSYSVGSSAPNSYTVRASSGDIEFDFR